MTVFGETEDNPVPGYCAEWHSGADPYITSVNANNPSGWNDGLRGDTYIGYFHPLHESFDGPDYNNELYFMIMNGLTSVDASPAGVHAANNFGISISVRAELRVCND